jgi:hypothetical protein
MLVLNLVFKQFWFISSRCFKENSLSQWPPSWQWLQALGCALGKLVSCFLLGVKCLKWIKNVFPSPTHCCNLIKWISFSISFAPRLAKLGGTTQDEISYTIIQYFNGKSFNTTLIKCLLHVITHAIKLVDNLFNLQWNLMSSFH